MQQNVILIRNVEYQNQQILLDLQTYRQQSDNIERMLNDLRRDYAKLATDLDAKNYQVQNKRQDLRTLEQRISTLETAFTTAQNK